MPYSGDPNNTSRDAARFHAGDTDTSDELLTDGEYDYLLITYNSTLLAAAEACDAIAAKYARKVDATVGKASKSLSQRAEAYAKRAATLRRKASTASATIRAGGVSRDDKDAQKDDTDRVKPFFARGQHTESDTTGEAE